MRVLKGLLEWATGSKKRKMEDEAMDAAAERMETALEELKHSNKNLLSALHDKELTVRRCK